MERNTISLLVHNHFGVLIKVAMLFGRRGCNIHTLTASPTQYPDQTRLTITALGERDKVVQVYNQLSRLEVVIEALLLSPENQMERTALLIRLKDGVRTDADALGTGDLYVKSHTLKDGAQVLEAIGSAQDVDDLVEKLRPLGIHQLCSSGSTALPLEGEINPLNT